MIFFCVPEGSDKVDHNSQAGLKSFGLIIVEGSFCITFTTNINIKIF